VPGPAGRAGFAPAVIALAFDPIARIGQAAVRWETLGIAAAVFVALILAALAAGRTPKAGGSGHLRRDDLLFVVLGVTAGGVAGGRLGYVLLHLDYYSANPNLIVDASSGGFELSLALVGGTLAGVTVAALLEGGASRWAHAAAIPLVVGLALGKAALALGGTGQGTPADLGWATAYVGPGPWGSLGPAIPSHPSQVYEALGDALVVAALVGLSAGGAFGRRDGRALAVAIALVAVVRFVVAFTWRDPLLVGPLRAEHLLALATLAFAAAAWVAFGRVSAAFDDDRPEWPEPGIVERWREPRAGS
jgi:phosphatidylglycerol:prolipoprotein diacylglycerol transferase